MGIVAELRYIWKHRGTPEIAGAEGGTMDTSPKRFFFEQSYDNIEVVRRGVDLIVDSASEIDINITEALNFMPAHEGKRKQNKNLNTLLNFWPNESEDTSTLRRQLIMDFVLTGNCFQYFDGTKLYHLPSKLMTVKKDKKNKVSHYELNSEVKFETHEIIHTKDNSADSIYVGKSRLYSTRRTITILRSMLNFQESFFENGAVPGLIIQTPNILGARIKQKLLDDWTRIYKPNTGGRRPIILDGDMKVNPLSQTKFSELEFEESITSHETKILKALGVPPVLLNSGNNANLRPNIQLFYETTVLPLVAKMIGSYEKFFAWDMEPEVVKVRALRPELKDQGQYLTGLVNGGIMTPNEARAELRLEPIADEEANDLRIPANIAGSAVEPSEGGRPPEDDEND